jgi:hypothetical protein
LEKAAVAFGVKKGSKIWLVMALVSLGKEKGFAAFIALADQAANRTVPGSRIGGGPRLRR